MFVQCWLMQPRSFKRVCVVLVLRNVVVFAPETRGTDIIGAVGERCFFAFPLSTLFHICRSLCCLCYRWAHGQARLADSTPCHFQKQSGESMCDLMKEHALRVMTCHDSTPSPGQRLPFLYYSPYLGDHWRPSTSPTTRIFNSSSVIFRFIVYAGFDNQIIIITVRTLSARRFALTREYL